MLLQALANSGDVSDYLRVIERLDFNMFLTKLGPAVHVDQIRHASCYPAFSRNSSFDVISIGWGLDWVNLF